MLGQFSMHSGETVNQSTFTRLYPGAEMLTLMDISLSKSRINLFPHYRVKIFPRNSPKGRLLRKTFCSEIVYFFPPLIFYPTCGAIRQLLLNRCMGLITQRLISILKIGTSALQTASLAPIFKSIFFSQTFWNIMQNRMDTS